MVTQAARRSVPEAVNRLLFAWHGEVEARAVYKAVAAREHDPERAAILRRMADAEAGHRTTTSAAPTNSWRARRESNPRPEA